MMVGFTNDVNNDSLSLKWYLLLAWPTIWILSVPFSCSRSTQCFLTAVALEALYFNGQNRYAHVFGRPDLKMSLGLTNVGAIAYTAREFIK